MFGFTIIRTETLRKKDEQIERLTAQVASIDPPFCAVATKTELGSKIYKEVIKGVLDQLSPVIKPEILNVLLSLDWSRNAERVTHFEAQTDLDTREPIRTHEIRIPAFNCRVRTYGL